MARIRSIKPEFWTSEQVMECSPLARLLFIGMWNFADDHGRMVVAPKTIKAQVFPSDTEIDSANVRRMLDELSANGLVTFYTVENKEYLEITGWRHQKIDHPHKPKHPDRFGEYSTNLRRTLAPDIRKDKRKEEDAPRSAYHNTNGAAGYAFEAGVIKLTQKHLDQWAAAFKHLDLAAELLALERWAAEQKDWFHAVKGALAKRNREAKAALDRLPLEPKSDWRRAAG